MRLQVRLPVVKPDVYELPATCPHGCGGQHYRRHGVPGERKLIRDLGYDVVTSYRYQCVRCGRTFRVYPQGVNAHTPQSERFRALTVLLYVLGLSYGAVEDFTVALGCGVSKTTVYNNVQAAGAGARKKLKTQVQEGGSRAVIGADGTFLKLRGATIGLEVVVDDRTGELLGLDITVSESHTEIITVIREVIAAVEPEVLVSDDHGAYHQVIADTGLAHQLCRSHAKRNVDALAESIQQQLAHPEPLPAGVDLSPAQVRTDLAQLQQLIRARPPDGEQQLAQLYARYKEVPAPKPAQRHSVWYRVRMMVTRLWNRWPALTLDQRRDDLNGTNNSCERLIGWWIKERYRTMRGYKREESIKNVVTLTALLGAHPGYELGSLVTT